MPYTPPFTAYPLPSEIAQLDESTQEIVDDLRATRFQGGGLRVSAMQPVFKRAWRLRHRMDAATYADYETFYQNYSRTTWSFTWAGDSVSRSGCCFIAPPVARHSGELVEVEAAVGQQ